MLHTDATMPQGSGRLRVPAARARHIGMDDTGTGTGATLSVGVLRPRRGPRAAEIDLMRSLAAGPRAVTSGPIGRCVKRHWCRALVMEAADAPGGRSTVLFALTETGRTLIADG